MSAAAAPLSTDPRSVEQMAFERADEVMRSDVEEIGRFTLVDNQSWYDLEQVPLEDQDTLMTALSYMQARGDALPYRVICHPNYPFLRRFEARR